MKRATRSLLLGVAGVAAAVILFHVQILTALGGYLEKSQAPEKADIALVLAGDSRGNRILKAASLVREGFVPRVLVSGPEGNYGFHECDLAIPFAVKAGYPQDYFEPFPNEAHSTKEERDAAIPVLRAAGVRRVLLVTSDYHTRRAGGLFRSGAQDIAFIVVSAPDANFSPGGWWRSREGRKTFAFEWIKTVAEWFGL